ncbi:MULTISPECIES: ABC transporter permease [Cetobacterium]|jgi:putative ABC transport system permease protein|uniref:ABC transporter permease n=1 Tax=Candidatus Cetobacterium colombiensis TaxID=3073100 RepID=A0ABU4WAK8_9FUSO|nr:ABC transporter permease [Candidatus Cetobacterium colombiensis]MDX8336052.1 ABC transporter permease [Candidatus Cetobacterium colombiensis]
MAQDIFLPNLLYFGIFLIPIFYIMNYLEIRMISNVIKSIFRMFIQLMLVGVYLHYILSINNTWINLAYLCLMTFACTFTVVRDVKINHFKFYIIVTFATAIPLVLNMLIFSELLLNLKDPFDAIYLIPISGMILGNTLNGMIVTINDFLNNLNLHEDSYLLSLSFGATKLEALKPFIASAITLAFKPSVATMANVGLVSLPGMMTGQILGGSLPTVAIKYQIAIMIALFICRFLSSFILLYFCTINFFDKYSIFTLRNRN